MKTLTRIFIVCLGCCAAGPSLEAMPVQENVGIPGGAVSFNQTREQIAALPRSADVPPPWRPIAPQASMPSQPKPPQLVHRQSSTGQGGYEYPAANQPGSNGSVQSSSYSGSFGNAQPTRQNLTWPTAASTSYGTRVAANNSAAAYNQNTYNAYRTGQVPRQPTYPTAMQVASAQQAQARAIQLAGLAQTQQQQAQQTLAQAQQSQARAVQLAQAAQPTAAYQAAYQTAYVQPTLGLGSANPQACHCVPVSSPSASGLTETAMRVPASGTNSGGGLGIAPLKLQNMPVGTYFGTGIVGQPTAYRDGQPIRNLFRYITP